ncbi:hypothetical protein HMPREF1235_1108 [Streptococcus pyogenes GA41208]|nr:hypothetical protein HMPREF1235_1108 [Streptococcus pyogenes GA41208]
MRLVGLGLLCHRLGRLYHPVVYLECLALILASIFYHYFFVLLKNYLCYPNIHGLP